MRRGDDTDAPRCLVCDCLLCEEVDGPGQVCIACRHDTSDRWDLLTRNDRRWDGVPAEEQE
jgi:hypothetical protein